jgi:uncharacterized protein (TIGR02246 family)
MIARSRGWYAALVCASALVLATAARLDAQAPAAGAVSAGGDRAAVAALQAWVEAFNSRDPKRIVALYAPTAVFWGTTAPAIATTPEQVWAYFKDSGQRPAVRVAIDSTHARVFGDVAVVSGGYTFADVTDGAASNVRPARYSMVFRRINGRWLIVDHHSSRVPAP